MVSVNGKAKKKGDCSQKQIDSAINVFASRVVSDLLISVNFGRFYLREFDGTTVSGHPINFLKRCLHYKSSTEPLLVHSSFLVRMIES